MINSTVSKTSYDAQSGVLEYPIGFQYMTNGLTGAPELKVKVDGIEAEFGKDFKVTSDKGHISFFVEPAVGAKIEIIRTTSRLQESDYQYGRINPEQIEKDFDRLTMRDQELTQSDEDIGVRIDANVAEIAAAKARITTNEGDIDLLEDKTHELENAISEEAENRAHEDSILSAKIEQLNTRNEEYRTALQNAIAAESAARSEADTQFQKAITDETNARSAADTNLTNLISDTNNTVAAVNKAVQDVDAKVITKQDKLVAGQNIKIEGNVISAEGGSGGSGGGIKQFVTMPEASEVAGEVVQYIGEDGDFLHGYFYESFNLGAIGVREVEVLNGDAVIEDPYKCVVWLNNLLTSKGKRTLVPGDRAYLTVRNSSSPTVTLTVYPPEGVAPEAMSNVRGPDMTESGIVFGPSKSATNFNIYVIEGEGKYEWRNVSMSRGAIANTATGESSLTVAGSPATGKFSTNVGVASSVAADRSVAVGEASTASATNTTAVGFGAQAGNGYSVAIGSSARATNTYATAVGYGATANGANSVQLGQGTNNIENSLQFKNYPVIDGSGNLVEARAPWAGKQYSSMPTATNAKEGQIVQYIGATTDMYTEGHFYKCVSGTSVVVQASGYTMDGTTITVTIDSEKFLAQNPVWADYGTPMWRADGSGGTWNVWTQDPNIQITPEDLRDVWGINVVDDSGNLYMAGSGASLQVMQAEDTVYSWAEVELGGGGASLPDQTDNAGKFLQTNGSEVSWGSALVNEASGSNTNLSITGGKTPLTDPYGKGTNVGISSKATGSSTAFGYNADASKGTYSVAIGYGATANSGYVVSVGFSTGNFAKDGSIAIGGYAGMSGGRHSISFGYEAKAKGDNSILINTSGSSRESSTANVFLWANKNGFYTLFKDDGTVPPARMANLVEQEPSDTGGTYIFNIGNRMVMMGGVVDLEDIQPGAAVENLQILFPEHLGDTTYIFPQLTIVSSDSHELTADVSTRAEDSLEIYVKNNGDRPATGVKISWQVVGMIGSGTIH